MGEWVFDPSGNNVAIGPVYGPYQDGSGSWSPVALSVNPLTDRARVLWNRSDGAAGVWTMDSNGNAVTVGPTLGPFSGWTAIGIATASDDSSYLLWQRTDGAMGEWTLDANGNPYNQSTVYGPYTDNRGNTWAAYAISVNPGTDYARIVFERSDGLVGVWIMDNNDNYSSGGDVTYGPYSDSGGNWNPIAIATAQDSSSYLLWARDDGAAGVWILDSNVNPVTVGPTYGPYSDSYGGWGPQALGVNPGDDTTRLLWDRNDGGSGLWALNSSGNETSVGPTYGPFKLSLSGYRSA